MLRAVINLIVAYGTMIFFRKTFFGMREMPWQQYAHSGDKALFLWAEAQHFIIALLITALAEAVARTVGRRLLAKINAPPWVEMMVSATLVVIFAWLLSHMVKRFIYDVT